MIARLADFSVLAPGDFMFLAGIVFLAGMVRGFAGFALSALVMAGAVIILPPIELIPVCFLLEMVASLVMFRGGLRDADMGIVWGLAIGSALGVPIGLYATRVLPVEASRMVALFLVLSLAAAQLLRLRPRFLATRPGLYVAGLFAGMATGLASVGGLVVALYVLARDAPPRAMRASLVTFLFISMFTTVVYLLLYGVMDGTALRRGLVLIPPVLLGIVVGSALFRPALEKVYRRFCLTLLIALAASGLVQMGW